MTKQNIFKVAKMEDIKCYLEKEEAVADGCIAIWYCRMTVVDSQNGEELTFNAVWTNYYPDIKVGDLVIVTTQIKHDSTCRNRVEVLELNKINKSESIVW